MDISIGTAHPNNSASNSTGNSTSTASNEAIQREKLELLEEQREIRSLAARDREVKAHEQAHAAVGGVHAGHPNFQFTQGPNGVRYAHSGHVNIDVSPVANDPQATLAKMQTVARAALAPAEPSAQDRSVAAKANSQAAQARAELAQLNAELEGLAGQSPPAKPQHAMSGTSGSLLDLVV